MSLEDKVEQARKRREEILASRASVKIKAEHTVKEGETLGGIALKYYGSAVKDKWMKIYEHNKGVIGDNPGLIKPGQVLKIPEL